MKKKITGFATLLALLAAGALFLTGCGDGSSSSGSDSGISKVDLQKEIDKVQDWLDDVKLSANDDGKEYPVNMKWLKAEDKTKLESAIAAAKAKLDTTNGQRKTAKEDLLKVYNEVKASLKPGTSTDDFYTGELESAIEAAKVKLAAPRISEDGSDVPTASTWVTQQAHDDFSAAIEYAEEELEFAYDQDQIDEAIQALATASAAFQPSAGLDDGSVLLCISAETINDEADTTSTKVDVTFNKAVAATDAKAGFTIKAGDFTLTINSAAVSDTKITFTLSDETPVIKDDDEVTVSYIGGNVVDGTNPGVALAAFADKLVKNNVTVAMSLPYITKAEVDTSNASNIKVTFSGPVKIDTAKLDAFTVKVNDKPAVRIGSFSGNTDPLLDKSMDTRTVTGATAASDYAAEWTLTASASAKHGEIIRLAVDDMTAARGPARGTGLMGTAIPEFIVKNLVPRSGTVLSAAGFYKDGVSEGSITANGQLYQNAITWLTTTGNQADGAVYTIVLGEDQTYAGAATFTAAQIAGQVPAVVAGETHWTDKSFTIVLASTGGEKKIQITGTGSALVIRNGITLIIEKDVAIEHENGGAYNSTSSTSALITVKDGGKLILDGGEIRKNYTTASGAAGVHLSASEGGSNSSQGGEAYFIMNSGKITGNVIKNTTRGEAGGGIGMMWKTYFVMHGGEVSNNKAYYAITDTGSVPYPPSGGISGHLSVTNGGALNNRSMMTHIYMTGGKISENELLDGGAASNVTNVRVTAATLSICGTFQKTGGIIEPGTNSMGNGSSAAKHAGVYVQSKFGGTGASDSHVWYRDTAADENVMLFAQGIRTASGVDTGNVSDAIGYPDNNMTKPDFAPNNWEN